MGVFQNGCEVDSDIYVTRKIGPCTREIYFVLLIELSFEGSEVKRRTLATDIFIDIHGEATTPRQPR